MACISVHTSPKFPIHIRSCPPVQQDIKNPPWWCPSSVYILHSNADVCYFMGYASLCAYVYRTRRATAEDIRNCIFATATTTRKKKGRTQRISISISIVSGLTVRMLCWNEHIFGKSQVPATHIIPGIYWPIEIYSMEMACGASQ